MTSITDRAEAARSYIKSDLDDALRMIADVRKLMPDAKLDAAVVAQIDDQLSRADFALKAAKYRLLEAPGGAA